MWQKIKKCLQVLALIWIGYFMYRIFFVHYPNEDTEKILACLVGCFACLHLFTDCGE